jgi:transcriptional regulator with PAS, ATPase and Fis domain
VVFIGIIMFTHQHLIYIIKEGKKPMYDFSKEQDELWEAIKIFEDRIEVIEDDNVVCDLNQEVNDYIFEKICQALLTNGNNRTRAAESLGIKRETLLAKMKKYAIA